MQERDIASESNLSSRKTPTRRTQAFDWLATTAVLQ